MSLRLLVLAGVANTALAGTDTWSPGDNVNLYGRPLKECSEKGMAITGYTRTGYCNLHQGDSGSHNVCIDISNVANGENFCSITGQPDWCSENDRCDSIPGSFDCPRENWCICQWAFASLIAARGCSAVSKESINCEATSGQTIMAYRDQMSLGGLNGGQISESSSAKALACLQSLCDLSDEYVKSVDYSGEEYIPANIQTQESDEFFLQTSRVCTQVVETKEECIEAGRALGLSDLSAEDCGCRGTSKPAKCYWASGQLWFNPRTYGSCSSDYTCICKDPEAVTEAPIEAPVVVVTELATEPPKASVEEINDKLMKNWGSIFPTGNRNAGGPQFFKWIFDNAQSQHEFDEMNKLYCGVSGSIVRPNSKPDHVKIANLDGDGHTCGDFYRCCAPCTCDIQKYPRVERMTMTAGSETFERAVISISDPCRNPDAMPSAVNTFFCENGRTPNAVLTPGGRLVMAILLNHDDTCSKPLYGAPPGGEQYCNGVNGRSKLDACQLERNGGMGSIFAKLTCVGRNSNTPECMCGADEVTPLLALPEPEPATAFEEEDECAGKTRRQGCENSGCEWKGRGKCQAKVVWTDPCKDLKKAQCKSKDDELNCLWKRGDCSHRFGECAQFTDKKGCVQRGKQWSCGWRGRLDVDKCRPKKTKKNKGL